MDMNVLLAAADPDMRGIGPLDNLLPAAGLAANGILVRRDGFESAIEDPVVLFSEIAHADDAARSRATIIAAVTAAHRIAGHELLVTASIGISVFLLDGEDAESLIKSADAAMYQAK
jgi:GGDEF domain-containing protein